jgi:hypothetical protein
MCEIVEKLCEERAHERAIESARKMIALDTYPHEKIAFILDLPLSEVQKLAEEMSGQPAAEKE